MKKVIVFVLCIFIGIFSVNAEKIEVSLNDCVDGDTAWFNLDGEKTKFRFLGIDTPESVHPKKSVELYGKDASEYTCNLLTNANKIEIEYDEESDKTDKYNRHLAWIWVDDILLEQSLISIGYAQVAYIYGNYKYVNDLCLEQEKAISSKEGIWNNEREVGYCSTIDYSDGSLLSKKTYKVIFRNKDKEKEVLVVEGSKLKEEKIEEEAGQIFKGWYLNGELFDFDTLITSSIILEAKYSVDYLYVILVFGLLFISLMSKKKKKRRR